MAREAYRLDSIARHGCRRIYRTHGRQQAAISAESEDTMNHEHWYAGRIWLWGTRVGAIALTVAVGAIFRMPSIMFGRAAHLARSRRPRWRLVLLASSILIGAFTLLGGAGPLTLAASAATPTTVNAGVVLRHTGPGGYAMTQDGKVMPFGGAPALPGTGVAIWPGQNNARGIALRTDDLGGYVLDLYGGIHPFGNAPPLAGGSYWPGWDIARGIVLRSDNAGGYVLDGYGGIHPFGNAPPLAGGSYWPGWDIARGIALIGSGSGGYVLDGWGGIHPFGNAPGLYDSAYWPGSDLARGVAVNSSGSSGMMIDTYGNLHPVTPSPLHGFGPYSIVGTASKGLPERSAPSTSSTLVGTLTNATEVYIACQASAGSYATSGSPAADTIWDQLTSGLYVADYWVSTPAVGTFTTGLPRCNVTPPVPFTGGGSGVSCANFAHTFSYPVSSGIVSYDISIWATLCSNGSNLYVKNGTTHCSASYPATDEYFPYWCGSVTNSPNSIQLGANSCGDSGLNVGNFGLSLLGHEDYWPRWTLTYLGNGQVGESGVSGSTTDFGPCSRFS
jgi:hypothetical protein